jgi:methionine-rich copper-binding protein CopC
MNVVFMESEGKKRLIRISVWIAVLSLLLAVVSSLATALAASAHAALLSMSPAAGSTVTKAPARVVLTFNEAISTSFATVTVTGQDGSSVSSGRPLVSGTTVTQKLTDVGSGRYTVAFRVVSEDGHPVSDKATFTVRLPAVSTTTTTPSTTTSVAAQSATPSTTSSAPTRPGGAAGADPAPGSPALLWGLGAAAVALVGAGALGVGRRRSGSE